MSHVINSYDVDMSFLNTVLDHYVSQGVRTKSGGKVVCEYKYQMNA